MIGVYGGTFDPVHYGHLRPLRELDEALRFTPLHIVPSASPPHRPTPAASGIHRLAMLQLACAGTPWQVDDRELRRGGLSYTVDTLTGMRAEYPDRTLCLVLGLDAFLGLPDWHRWEEVFELAGIAVMARPGAPPELPRWAMERLCTDPRGFVQDLTGRCYLHRVTPVDISATRVRARIAAGEDIGDMVPAPVLDYIRRHRLYGSRSY